MISTAQVAAASAGGPVGFEALSLSGPSWQHEMSETASAELWANPLKVSIRRAIGQRIVWKTSEPGGSKRPERAGHGRGNYRERSGLYRPLFGEPARKTNGRIVTAMSAPGRV